MGFDGLVSKISESVASDRTRVIVEETKQLGPVEIEPSLEESESSLNIVARGISDENTAEEMAKAAGGTVIQDDEDKEKFMVVVKESAIKEDRENAYSASVDVRITNHEDIERYNMYVKYDFEIEHRSWGIKAIDLMFYGEILLETETFGDIRVDLQDAEIEWTKADTYSIEIIEIDLDESGAVKKVTVDANYISK